MINKAHIKTFCDLVKEKGYVQPFVNSGGTMSSLSDLLTFHLAFNHEQHAQNKATEIILSTVTDSNKKGEDFTSCTLVIGYDREKGFQASEAYINRLNPAGEALRTIPLVIRANKAIPAVAVVNKLALAPVKIVRVRTQRGINLN